MSDKFSAWANLPAELRALPQWCVAGASKAPLSVQGGELRGAASTRPNEWMTFDAAAQLAWVHRETQTVHVKSDGTTVAQIGYDIGFMLHQSDPFTCIDLDVKDAQTHPNLPHMWTTNDQFDRYSAIIRELDTYTEMSRSGKGVHLWLRGNIGTGFRRDGVEVYSQERFIISTGFVTHLRPIQEGGIKLANLVSRMAPVQRNVLEELPEKEDDRTIYELAASASNSEKFLRLWSGDWQNYYPSQSEADLGLMSMFCFYSESNEQCRRLFRRSALGQREKATKNNRYLDYTLTTIRNRQAASRRADISAILMAAETAEQTQRTMRERAASEIQRLTGAPSAEQGAHSRTVAPLHVAPLSEPVQGPAPEAVQLAGMAPVTQSMVTAGSQGIPWPPGFGGHIARYMYQAALRPVKEVSIVATLGLLAGLMGKAWCIPKSGLNLYVILIARSAIGKEAMHSGISEIIDACRRENPTFSKYVDFTEYASGPALIKACVANPCFVNVSGEWGRKLKRLAMEDGRDGPLQTLRTQMTNLYQKSGPQSIVGGIGYSAVDNNVASVSGVSYSMIGETTPGTFYESLTESMMEDGFLSRFLVLEYEGQRPEPNPQMIKEPDDYTRQALNAIAVQADSLILKNHSMPVSISNEASAMARSFEVECDKRINSTNDESRRQMWNRAGLKSLRIAALLAVADNWLTPVITPEHVAWAQLVIRNDIRIMSKRLDGGDVGQGDKARERKLIMIMQDYLTTPPPPGYKVPPDMQKGSIIPRSYLQIKVQNTASFYNHRLGANKVLDETLNSLMGSGYIMEVQKDKLVETFSYHGRAYRILKLPAADADSAA